MYSITVDKDIIVEIKEVDINSIIPHEKVLLDKTEANTISLGDKSSILM